MTLTQTLTRTLTLTLTPTLTLTISSSALVHATLLMSLWRLDMNLSPV